MPKFSEFKNKKVVIMGLGLHGGGLGSARFMARSGAKVIVTDLKKESDLKPSLEALKEFKNIEYVLGQHRIEDFKKADLIIKNPAVPEDSEHIRVARKSKVPVESDIGIFFQLCPAQIIGVTGSKGKSSVSALITEVLKTTFRSVFLAGNIRISVLDILPEVKKRSIVVVELSSWQLEGLASHKISPHVAVITNIFKEHLNRYPSYVSYKKSKSLIFKWQDQDDYLVVNQNLKDRLKALSKARSQLIFYDGNNQSVAREVGKIYKIEQTKIEKSISGFKGLPGRHEVIAKLDGVTYINDTTATHPRSVVRALESLSGGKIVLIVGGEDKAFSQGDLDSLARVIKQRVKQVVTLPGTMTDRLSLAKVALDPAGDMAQALDLAISSAREGDTVLLSPGAASFNLFKHEFDRGEQFERLVKKV